MTRLDGSPLLQLWEDGERRHPLDRALLLFAFAEPETAGPADVPLGTCNSALMRLSMTAFGTRLPVWTDCPACHERMTFELDAGQLPPMLASPRTVTVQGMSFRCPSTRDLAAVADYADAELAAMQLFHDCAETRDSLPSDAQALDALRVAVEQAIELADPWSDLALSLQCPACGQPTEVCLDAAGYLWESVTARAQTLLDDVHALAQAYGWSETQVLALSEGRRSAYLARVRP